MMFLLDTDVLIDILRKRPEAEDWIASLPSPPALSGVAALEASFGARSACDLRDAGALEATFHVVWPEARDLQYAVEQLAPLRLTHGIGPLDAVTATMALRCGLTAATFNVKHFRVVPGLAIARPYER